MQMKRSQYLRGLRGPGDRRQLDRASAGLTHTTQSLEAVHLLADKTQPRSVRAGRAAPGIMPGRTEIGHATRKTCSITYARVPRLANALSRGCILRLRAAQLCIMGSC